MPSSGCASSWAGVPPGSCGSSMRCTSSWIARCSGNFRSCWTACRMSFEARASSYTRSYYVALAIRTAVSLGWLATICWLAQLDEQAFLRQPRLSLGRRIGLRWAPSYRLKLALWHLLHGHLAAAARANPLVFVVTYLASALTWQTCRSLVRLSTFR